MSCLFETVAGAFAVVGLADVIIRTARDLYNFLHMFKDSPEDISRLRETIMEITALLETVKFCQRGLVADYKSDCPSTALPGSATTLKCATKALHRELQSLSTITSRFNGTQTWGRLKYMLSEARVKKALQNLDRCKMSLANGLILAGM